MERSMLHIFLSVLILTPAVLSEVNIKMNYDEDLKDTLGKKFDIRNSIYLKCALSGDIEGVSVKWEKDDQELKASSSERLTASTKGNSHEMKIAHSSQDDAGTYFCIALKDGQEVARGNISLSSKIHVKTPDNLNFVEGEAIKIHCLVLGKPSPTLSWRVGNETYEESRDRVELLEDPESKIPNAIFVIKTAEMADRATYSCVATSETGQEHITDTMIRIKDKYAALWPFLGICAEVFVLCAIILIYEKKRNKTELEESDTDQSPDQKNTPDHGKDSNLRHRQ